MSNDIEDLRSHRGASCWLVEILRCARNDVSATGHAEVRAVSGPEEFNSALNNSTRASRFEGGVIDFASPKLRQCSVV